MLKAKFQKEGPKTLICGDFRKFTNTNFQLGILNNLNSRNSLEYCSLKKSFVEISDKHAQKRIKILLSDQKPHVNETLHSAIMKRSQLKNKAMKSKSKNDTTEHRKHCNIVVKLNNCCKKNLFDNLEILKHFCQLGSHISPRNVQMLMQIFSLLKIIELCLIIAQ